MLFLALLGSVVLTWRRRSPASNGPVEPFVPSWPPPGPADGSIDHLDHETVIDLRDLPGEPVRVGARERAWVIPTAGGEAPDGYPVKVKLSSGIFHVPGMLNYERTHPDRCYRSADDASADGFRPAKR